jgi:predicted secreted protein
MASNAVSAFGTLLNIGDGATPTENFSTVAELRSLNGPSFSAETIDVTTHNTPTPFRRYISGLLDGGEISFDINFIPTDPTHGYGSGILKDMLDRARRNFQVVFPDTGTTTWLFPCIITGFEVSSDPADVLMASITLKVAGPPTLE